AGSGAPSDSEPPQIVGDLPEDITISCADDLPDMEVLEAEDECSYDCTSELPTDDASALDPCGLGEVIRTWRVFDCAGNEGTPHVQSIFVQDFDAPEIDDPPANITIACDDPLPVAVELEAEDDCDINVSETDLPFDEISNLDSDGTGELLRTWYVEDCRGNFEEYTQTITLLPLTADIVQDDICADSILLFTSEFDTYTWEYIDSMGVATDLNVNNDSILVGQAGIYRLSVQKGLCSAVVRDTILIAEPVDYTLEEGTVCSESFVGNTVIDLLSLIQYNSVEDSISISNINGNDINNLVIDFDGQMEGIVAFIVELYGDSICPPIMDTLYVNVVDCSCPELSDIGEICLLGVLDTIQLDSYSPQGFNGSWSINPVDSELTLIDNLLIIGAQANEANYTLTFTFEDPDINDNCLNQMSPPNQSDLTLVSQEAVELSPDFSVCNQTGGTLPAMVDLDTLEISQGTGSWQTSSPVVTIAPDNTVDFTNVPPDLYYFTLSYNAQAGNCPSSVDSIGITVFDCSCPPIGVIPDSIVCNNTLLNLSDFEIAGIGTWQYLGDGPDINADLDADQIFNTDGLDSGFYSFEFSLDNPSMNTACTATLVSVVEVVNTPEAELAIPDVNVCNAVNNENIPVVFDLNSALDINSDPGIWTSSAFNGDLSDPSNVSFEGIMSGSYLFSYQTIIAQNLGLPCSDTTVNFTITVDACQCPDLPILNTQTEYCSESGLIDLTPVNQSVGPGSWTLNGPGQTGVSLTGQSIDLSGFDTGVYTISYTFDDMAVPAVCTDETIEYSFEIFAPVALDLPPDVTICDRDDPNQGPASIDFTLIDPGANGQWTAPGNYTGDFTDISNVSFVGFEGNSFTFTFTSDEPDNPCPPSVANYIVQVVDCGCPNLMVAQIPDFCSIDPAIDLNDYLDQNAVDGNWSVEDMMGQLIPLMNTELDPQMLPAGQYAVSYTATESVPIGCEDQMTVQFEIFKAPEAGLDNADSYCLGDVIQISLNAYLIDADLGGVWSQSSGETLGIDATSPILDISTMNSGVYEFNYLVEGEGPCLDDTAQFVIEILELPQIDGGSDLSIGCNSMEVILGNEIMPQSNIVYTWFDPSNTPLSGNGPTAVATSGGIYTMEVLDINTGCLNFDQVEVIEDQSFPQFLVSGVDPVCSDLKSGMITISQFSGGNGSYNINIEGPIELDTFSYSGDAVFLNGLQSGLYTITVDSDGCPPSQVIIELLSPASFEVNAGPSTLSFELGQVVSLSVDLEGTTLAEIQSIEWYTSTGNLICGTDPLNCQSLTYMTDNQELIIVEVSDLQGCIAVDSIRLIPFQTVNIYMPNIINPRAQDGNNLLKVFSNNAISDLTEYIVYDRWGNIVYQDLDGKSLTDPNEIWWNGTTDGYNATPGVYVIQISYQDPEDSNRVKTEANTVTVLY
ncbi:MAG: hypothetical protein HKN09_09835, partial [Saprospiraceae bacterium]|nr:hypothetical protein [Saprospiraceae bacterium]